MLCARNRLRALLFSMNDSSLSMILAISRFIVDSYELLSSLNILKFLKNQWEHLDWFI